MNTIWQDGQTFTVFKMHIYLCSEIANAEHELGEEKLGLLVIQVKS